MGEQTGISWADATLNFWVGCTKVSTGDKGACENCYAETWAKRWPAYRDTWGPGAARKLFAHLRAKAMKLERLAIAKAAVGDGAFFCFSNSLSDIFDNEVPIEWLAEAFGIMRATPHVTYLLLTKRCPNIVKRSEAAGGLPPNAALGITVVTQAEANRDLPGLLFAVEWLRAAFSFVSIEPMMEAIDLTQLKFNWSGEDVVFNALTGTYSKGTPAREQLTRRPLTWVIAGGESGRAARAAHPGWFRWLRDQCAEFGVVFHFKQWGEWAPYDRGQLDSEALAVPGSTDKPVQRFGKDRTGRLLDAVLHDARPDSRS